MSVRRFLFVLLTLIAVAFLTVACTQTVIAQPPETQPEVTPPTPAPDVTPPGEEAPPTVPPTPPEAPPPDQVTPPPPPPTEVPPPPPPPAEEIPPVPPAPELEAPAPPPPPPEVEEVTPSAPAGRGFAEEEPLTFERLPATGNDIMPFLVIGFGLVVAGTLVSRGRR